MNIQVPMIESNEDELTRVRLEMKVRATDRNPKGLEGEMKRALKKVEEITHKNSNLSDINDVYNSEIKIQKRVTQKIKNELIGVEQINVALKSDLEDISRTKEKV